MKINEFESLCAKCNHSGIVSIVDIDELASLLVGIAQQACRTGWTLEEICERGLEICSYDEQ